MNKRTIVILAILFAALLGRVLYWNWEEKPITASTPVKESAPLLVGPINANFMKDYLMLNNSPNLKEGKFRLRVDLPLNRETTVYYLVPTDEDGKPLPSASNIIFSAPFNGESINNFSHRPWKRYFAETLGFSIFSFDVQAQKADRTNPMEYYIYPEAGWFGLVFKIQDWLIKEFQLTPKRLLVIGESAGGSMAQQLSVKYPAKIAAAALCGGSRYTQLKQPSDLAWCILNSWWDDGVPEAYEFKRQIESYGNHALVGETPPPDAVPFSWHSMGEESYALVQEFIRAIVELRDQNGGIIPPAENWPFSDKICGTRQFFPSKHFKELWEKLPHEVNAGYSGSCALPESFAIFPTNKNCQGIVILVDDLSQSSLVVPQVNLYHWAKMQLQPIAFFLKNETDNLSDLSKALQSILAREEWQTLPVYLVGIGIGGSIAATAAWQNNHPRLKKIITINTPYELEQPEQYLDATRGDSQIPLTMYVTDPAWAPPSERPYLIVKPFLEWLPMITEAVSQLSN